MRSSSINFGRQLPLLLIATMSLAQENPTAESWLASAPPIPELKIPATQVEWQTRRTEIRTTLGKLLGDLPPRPSPLRVTVLSRVDKGDYWQEKFSFDNGAGETVTGAFAARTTASIAG